MKRVLLDENLPRQIKNLFTEIEILTVPDLGWQSKHNGELLAAMGDAGLTYLLTADRNLTFQPNIAAYRVKVIVLLTYDTRRKHLERFVPQIEKGILEWDDSAADLLEIDLRK